MLRGCPRTVAGPTVLFGATMNTLRAQSKKVLVRAVLVCGAWLQAAAVRRAQWATLIPMTSPQSARWPTIWCAGRSDKHRSVSTLHQHFAPRRPAASFASSSRFPTCASDDSTQQTQVPTYSGARPGPCRPTDSL